MANAEKVDDDVSAPPSDGEVDNKSHVRISVFSPLIAFDLIWHLYIA